ncbi:MAG: TetR/AcrR family transcriptional regulator [Bacillota bacterium]|nr:TetR/AcrR family transcriptional regulator [Bacillota bacterium]
MRIMKDPEIRRQEIIAIATQLFEEKGVAKTSMSAIATHLRIAKGLVYYYFDSKNALVEAVLDQLTHNLNQSLADIVVREELGFHEKLKAILRLYFSAIQSHPALLSLAPADPGIFALLCDGLSTIAFKHVQVVLQNGLDQGLISIDYPDYMLKILIKGLGDLYIDGVNDPNIHATLIEQTLGLKKDSFK